MPAHSASSAQPNRLAQEVSPYLLQHKDNPVAWYPWGDEAFAAAKAANKPVLLSIGYAACHWCHVMAHESFADPDVAALMNRNFVNIKLDREERPDLDAIYQNALSLLGQHGGWPLTMFLTPHGKPFWGGTYFPKADMYGRPGFPRVLQAIADAYHQEPDKVETNVAAIADALHRMARPQRGGRIDMRGIDEIAARIAQAVDPQNGGLGGPPKFPQPGLLRLLWRAWRRRQDPESFRNPVVFTLRRMSQGGIYDHLGGGYARYAVDAHWLIPHFEKMLYDNAQILELLTWAWQDTRSHLFRERAEQTVGWLLREMIARDAHGYPTGAFASSLDADSEGVEGKFYTWREPEVREVLGTEADTFNPVYDVSPAGNWDGVTILNRLQHPEPLDPATEARLAKCRERLFARREQRVRPAWDDKVLADWNGLMIGALAEAAAAFGRADWHTAACDAFAFVRDRMQSRGRLFHAWRHGEARHSGLLDDYAAMAGAALTLFEHTGKPAYRAQAIAWVETLDRHFWDPADGGYFITADDVNDVLVRGKHAQDSSQPAGNGLMLHVLARLHYLTGAAHYRERAEALIAAFAGEVESNFVPLATFLNGIERLHAGLQIVIVGPRMRADTQALLDVVHGIALPDRILQVVEPGTDLPAGHPAAGKTATNSAATAYVCRGPSCSLPITDPDALRADLAGAPGA